MKIVINIAKIIFCITVFLAIALITRISIYPKISFMGLGISIALFIGLISLISININSNSIQNNFKDTKSTSGIGPTQRVNTYLILVGVLAYLIAVINLDSQTTSHSAKWAWLIEIFTSLMGPKGASVFFFIVGSYLIVLGVIRKRKD